MKKIYLRLIEIERQSILDLKLEIFEGDIKKDKEYWEKHHNGKVRYFELKKSK